MLVHLGRTLRSCVDHLLDQELAFMGDLTVTNLETFVVPLICLVVDLDVALLDQGPRRSALVVVPLQLDVLLHAIEEDVAFPRFIEHRLFDVDELLQIFVDGLEVFLLQQVLAQLQMLYRVLVSSSNLQCMKHLFGLYASHSIWRGKHIGWTLTVGRAAYHLADGLRFVCVP